MVNALAFTALHLEACLFTCVFVGTQILLTDWRTPVLFSVNGEITQETQEPWVLILLFARAARLWTLTLCMKWSVFTMNSKH